MVRKRGILKCAMAAALLLAAVGAGAQEGGPGATRPLVTYVRVKPAMIDTWRTLQRDQVVPALKKAGLKQYTVYETLVSDQTEFVIVRPLPSFAEFNGPDLLEKALGVFYKDFAPLDGPPPLAATLGPEGVAEFLRKGAGLINQVEQSVLKRLQDLSY